MRYLQRFLAFTLAEVLITLGVIGVVAALTLPSVINKTRAYVLHNQFKKAYNVLLNVHQSMLSDGIDVYTEFIEADDKGYRSEEQINNQIETFVKYLKNAQLCNSSYQSCTGANYKAFDGINTAHINPDAYTKKTIMLPDMVIWTGDRIWAKARYYVDINGGRKGPNKLGYDLFTFKVTQSNKLEPETNYSTCTSGTTYYGFGCAYYALIDKSPDGTTSYWNGYLKY